MSEDQQALFYAQMAALEKDEVAGVLLALFLGSFGAHHFYLRRIGLGVTYLLLSWTGLPGLAGVIECFFMPGRVRVYNLQQAALLSAGIRGAGSPAAIAVAAPVLHCGSCGAPVAAGVRFCARCGASLP